MARLGETKIYGDATVANYTEIETAGSGTVPTGTAPFVVSSGLVCPNLNVETISGTHFRISGIFQWSPNASTWYNGVGYTGSAGARGTVGLKGYQGSQGLDGYRGSFGATGGVGARGATGYRGSAGTTGLTGDAGIAGLTGFTGSVGDVGTTGNRGTTGGVGANLSPGASTVVGSHLKVNAAWDTSGTIAANSYIDATNGTSYCFFPNLYSASTYVLLSCNPGSTTSYYGYYTLYSTTGTSVSYAIRAYRIDT